MKCNKLFALEISPWGKASDGGAVFNAGLCAHCLIKKLGESWCSGCLCQGALGLKVRSQFTTPLTTPVRQNSLPSNAVHNGPSACTALGRMSQMGPKRRQRWHPFQWTVPFKYVRPVQPPSTATGKRQLRSAGAECRQSHLCARQSPRLYAQ